MFKIIKLIQDNSGAKPKIIFVCEGSSVDIAAVCTQLRQSFGYHATWRAQRVTGKSMVWINLPYFNHLLCDGAFYTAELFKQAGVPVLLHISNGTIGLYRGKEASEDVRPAPSADGPSA